MRGSAALMNDGCVSDGLGQQVGCYYLLQYLRTGPAVVSTRTYVGATASHIVSSHGTSTLTTLFFDDNLCKQ